MDVSASLLAGFPEVVGESSRGMMVLLVKQVHLQKDVGAFGCGQSLAFESEVAYG